MGLMPEQFQALTMREFWIKHAAFSRAEDRRRALVFEHALMTVPGRKKAATTEMQRAINGLRRYPIKRWLMSE